MPVKIGIIWAVVRSGIHRAAQQKARKTDPAMAALLAEIATGQPVRVPLVEGQSARGLRTAISRAATSRGLTVETVEGDGFVAVRKADEPRTRKGKQASLLQEDSDDGGGHPSVGSRTRPRLLRCGIWLRGRGRGVSCSRSLEPHLTVRRATLRSVLWRS